MDGTTKTISLVLGLPTPITWRNILIIKYKNINNKKRINIVPLFNLWIEFIPFFYGSLFDSHAMQCESM